jgi:hypothetical protein
VKDHGRVGGTSCDYLAFNRLSVKACCGTFRKILQYFSSVMLSHKLQESAVVSGCCAAAVVKTMVVMVGLR